MYSTKAAVDSGKKCNKSDVYACGHDQSDLSHATTSNWRRLSTSQKLQLAILRYDVRQQLHGQIHETIHSVVHVTRRAGQPPAVDQGLGECQRAVGVRVQVVEAVERRLRIHRKVHKHAVRSERQEGKATQCSEHYW